MRIESSTVENHRFGTARRKGYDPDEVDAVMSRVADTLAQYERLLDQLQTGVPLAEDAASGEPESKSQLLANAKAAAVQILDAAKQQAATIRNEATAIANRIVGAAEDHLGAAQVDAQRIREEAASHIDLAATRSEELRSQADSVLTSAIAEAERVRAEAETASVAQVAEAEQMLHLAQAEVNRLATEATRDAELTRAAADAEAADILADARQQAETMINAAVEEARLIRDRARLEMEEIRASREAQAEELVASARNESAEIRAAAAAAAEAVTAQGRVAAEEALSEARTKALQRLTAAQEEAEALLDEAGREADATVAAAREDCRRLEHRIGQLRIAVAEFEAHTANLAEVAADRASLIGEMIDQDVEPGPPARPRGPASPLVQSGSAPASAATDSGLAEPDGSGELPARRALVVGGPPTSSNTARLEVDLRRDADDEEQFVYDGDEEGTETIYQRRGGIKRRVAAITSPDENESED